MAPITCNECYDLPVGQVRVAVARLLEEGTALCMECLKRVTDGAEYPCSEVVYLTKPDRADEKPPPRVAHESCDMPSLCDCDCRACMRAWWNAERPRPAFGQRRNVHEEWCARFIDDMRDEKGKDNG